MGYYEKFQKKMSILGGNHVDRELKLKQREFELYFENTLNKEKCLIDGKPEEVVFQDHSQSNNKDLSDDKYLVAPNSVEVHVGSYIDWRDSEWLVFTEESKTIPSHQQLKIKIVNEQIKWVNDRKVCNAGKGWGAYVQNQTLYTLGVESSGNHLAVVNAKMMMYMQDNHETASLKVGSRIFIGNGVYKVMFMDNVSRKGLINYLLEQDTIGEYDSVENQVADYSDPKIGVVEDVIVEDNPIIEGETTIKLARTATFTLLPEELVVTEWIVEASEGAENPLHINERTDTKLVVKAKDDTRFIGNQITIFAKLEDGTIVNKVVRIGSKY